MNLTEKVDMSAIQTKKLTTSILSVVQFKAQFLYQIIHFHYVTSAPEAKNCCTNSSTMSLNDPESDIHLPKKSKMPLSNEIGTATVAETARGNCEVK
jgi:hypothetical protein